MAEYHFTNRKYEKGRFTDERSGEWRAFSLNPNDIRDTKGFNAASEEIPGISHPHEQDGAGTERLISFTLRLDGEVGRRERPSNDKDNPQNIADEIRWYRSFIYTEGNARLGLPGSTRPILLFTFGSFFPGVRCKMRQANVHVLQWDAKLNPVRADLDIVLVEQVQFSISRSQIWDPSSNRGF